MVDDALYALDGLVPGVSQQTLCDSAACLASIAASHRGLLALRYPSAMGLVNQLQEFHHLMRICNLPSLPSSHQGMLPSSQQIDDQDLLH